MTHPYNNQENNGYGNKSNKRHNTSNNKSAYEIRTDVLTLALELHLANLNSKDDGGSISADEVVKTANTFNEFISKRNDR